MAHPLENARRIQEFLENNPTLNRADAARRFGISRARVTQQMTLISNLSYESQKLIDDYAEYPITKIKLTERKLKTILLLDSMEQQEQIRKMAIS